MWVTLPSRVLLFWQKPQAMAPGWAVMMNKPFFQMLSPQFGV